MKSICNFLKNRMVLPAFFLLFTISVFGQAKTIKGKVSDFNGESLIGVSIGIPGTNEGTITDVDGNYTISVPSSESVLVFSYVGYVTQNIKVGDSEVINVTLKPTIQNLDEVVVIGYGSTKKSDITTSIASVKGTDLQKENTGNFTNALQGKAAGVQVITNSGAPGAVPSVLIRGFTTISSNTSPLYVVDGIPMVGTGGNSNINSLSADEIESIEVLKDASAAAIYGTRASAGVVLVTTKRGKAGITKYDFNYSTGFQSSQKPYDVMNSQQYAEAMNLSYRNSNMTDLITETDNLNYTDWWSKGIRSRAPMTNASFNVSGGTEKHQFNINLTYFNQESFYNVGKWNRLTARINNDIKLAKWITLGIDLNPRREKWDNTPGWYGDYLQIDPVTPVMRPADQLTGTENAYSKYMRSLYTYVWNPVARESRQEGNGGDNYALSGNTYVDFHPIKNLVIRSQAGMNLVLTTSNTFGPEFTIDASHEFASNTSISRNKATDYNWTWQNTATYNLTKGKHNASAMIGMTSEEQHNDYVYAYGEGLPNTSENMREISAVNGSVKNIGGNETRSSLLSYISRLTYNYDNRYLLTATGRYDGSSKFMPRNKWAFFPSVSLAWRLSNEKFLKNVSFLSDAKIFAGWGAVGNQYLPNGVYLSNLATDYYVLGSASALESVTSPGTMKNPDIKWETVEEKNLGVDIKLFNSALSATFEVFQKKTHDMLFEMNYPYYSGFPNWGNIWTNIGKMQSSGFDASLDYILEKNKWHFDFGVTYSHVRVKMLEIAGTDELLAGPEWSSANTTRMVVGDEPGYFYGYKTNGIFQNYTEINSHTSEHGDLLQPYARPGDIRFVDTNNDGVINGDDRVKLGSPYPDFTGGFNFQAAYMSPVGKFDLGVNLYFSYGGKAVNWLVNNKYNAVGQTNLASDALDQAWHGEGTSTNIPILSHNDLNENFTKFSDLYVENASFMRMKLLQIGYSIPRKVCNALKLSDLRITFSGQNLFTWTKFTGVDPEAGFSPLNSGFQGYSYPLQKTYLFGINLSF